MEESAAERVSVNNEGDAANGACFEAVLSGDGSTVVFFEKPDGPTLMASDTPPGMEGSSGTRITVSLSGDDADLLRGSWEKLTDGAEVTMPLERQVWGDDYGQFTDRFGIQWMLNITGAAQE